MLMSGPFLLDINAYAYVAGENQAVVFILNLNKSSQSQTNCLYWGIKNLVYTVKIYFTISRL